MDKKSRDFVMGKLYLKNKDYRMAEKSFTEYLSVNPEDYQALKMLAQVQEQLNDTAKAFDLYQRCYLSQPDRSGVLLDICRLLLHNDPLLEHADKKKWLKLAEQAFPTNPIIRNLRESLPNDQNSHSTKVTISDMVLEKLNIVEDVLKNFDDHFRSLEDRLKTIEELLKKKEIGPVVEPKSDSSNLFSDSSKKLNMPTESSWLTPQKPAKENEDGRRAELKSSVAEGFMKLNLEPKSDGLKLNLEPKPEGLNLFGGKPNMPTESSWMTPPKPSKENEDGNWTKPKNPVAEGFMKLNLEPKTDALKFNLEPKTDGLKFNLEPKTDGLKFNLESKCDGANLFAESMKKFNMPLESSWLTSPEPAKRNEDGNADDDNDDDGVVPTEELPIENTCDMRPIEIKTGEEDEDILFKHRCKLFRFRDKEYKERGLGDIKVLKHKETGKGRLIMRREQINLVCLNCCSCQNIERVRETQVRFAGLDASDGDAELTVFLAKFKTSELTDEFLKHLKDLFTDE